ncbi:hydantoinase/oxoprolinase family protein [Falsiroseomonas sp.]|uniref:hydantoinase/oxoprolinase family protein n=1 Tax=Falsiroseomonas sp. TaxID=2870721 RepID=UPI00356B20B4
MTSEPAPVEGARRFRVGVDTGGTHTDLVVIDSATRRMHTHKVPSTLDDLTEGILDGLDQAIGAIGAERRAVEHFVYATTMVTNLIVEGVDAPVGLIATEGFRDVLEIARASRKPHIYDIQWRPPRPLVPRPLRIGVRERISHAGEVIEPLDEAGARAAIRQLRQAGCVSIAVCLLHAYANPAHERRIAALAAEDAPEIDVSLSSDIVREFREYERSSTTSLNAYVKRPLGRHLATLSAALEARGVPASPFIMRGNGGISTFRVAAQTPVAITHSGPMGGIIGGTAIAEACGISDIITLDMGGTSADVSLVLGGSPVLTTRGKLGAYPLLLPMLDLVTIGAGGGSIAHVDAGGAMRVGPRSAGARPGPACYGQGGTEPTVTDANLHAGRLNPGYFLAGRRQLDTALAETALRERLAKPLGIGVDAAAIGILAIAEAHMVNAIKVISVDRGHDPREFTLVGFGGAGPLHSMRLAEELGIHRVLIPPAPGNVSCMGLLAAHVRHDHALTRMILLGTAEPEAIAADLAEMALRATGDLEREGVPPDRRQLLATLDLRYQGQNYELGLPVAPDRLDAAELAALSERFHAEHERVYGYRLPGRAVQLVNLRIAAIGRVAQLAWPEVGTRKAPLAEAGRRNLLLPDGRVEAPVHRVQDLFAEDTIAGPAVVEYPGSTLFIPPGWTATFDRMRNAHLLHASAAGRETGR